MVVALSACWCCWMKVWESFFGLSLFLERQINICLSPEDYLNKFLFACCTCTQGVSANTSWPTTERGTLPTAGHDNDSTVTIGIDSWLKTWAPQLQVLWLRRAVSCPFVLFLRLFAFVCGLWKIRSLPKFGGNGFVVGCEIFFGWIDQVAADIGGGHTRSSPDFVTVQRGKRHEKARKGTNTQKACRSNL